MFAEARGVDAERNGIADGDEFFRLFPAFGADIDPELVDLHDRFALFRGLKVNRLAPDHARNLAVRREDVDFKRGKGDLVDAADRTEGDQPVVGNVDDLETDLVVVSGEHDAERGIGVQNPDGVSGDVGVNLVREGFQTLPEDLCGGNFKPGRTGSS